MTEHEPSPEPDAGIDRVRDLLFGAQMRASEEKLSGVERRVLERLTASRAEQERRLEALDAWVRGEVDSLVRRLDDERADRSTAIERLAAEVRETSERLSARLDDEGATARRERERLARELAEQADGLRRELHRVRDEEGATRKRLVDELEAKKADRTSLSQLLTDLATRLSEPPEESE